MGLVIDMNTLHCVFSRDSNPHPDFQPVLERIEAGRLKMVYGGTTYRGELLKTRKYLAVVQQLRTAQRAVQIRDDLVDQREVELKAEVPSSGFDDHHIIALACVSGSPVICTLNSSHYAGMKARSHYKDGKARRIYSRAKHVELLERAAKAKVRNAVGS